MVFVKGHPVYAGAEKGYFKKGSSINLGRKRGKPWNFGLKTSEATKEKQRQAKLANPVRYWQGKKRPDTQRENSSSWVGDNVGYDGLHDRIRVLFGEPSLCDNCGTKRAKKFEWANIDHEYKSEKREDWMRLCTSCHRRYDNAKFNKTKN